VSNWRRQALEEGQRASSRAAAASEVLRQLLVGGNDALLREYAERLTWRTGVTAQEQPVILFTLLSLVLRTQ
jgi:hypothetical protein